MAWFARITLPLVLLAAALGIYRLAFSSATSKTWAPARANPARVGSKQDWPEVVTDEQLAIALYRMQPPAEVNSNKWLHALRLWGPNAKFEDGLHPAGSEMLAYFLDDNVFRAKHDDKTPPLLTIGPGGVEVREWVAGDKFTSTSAAHRDDVLATLAESGVALETPIVTRNGTATVDRLLCDTFARYHPQLTEYEWSLISYIRYLFPQEPPVNRYGERVKFSQMVDEICDAPLIHGACAGLHRMEAAVLLYRLDNEYHALPPAARAKLGAHLAGVTRIVVQSQQPGGFWTRAWPEGAAAAKKDPGNRYDQILATGHILEYLALAPPEFQPPRETIVRAGQWLARAIAEEPEKELNTHYGPFSHAARALALWRGQEAWDAWLRLNDAAK